MDEQVVQPCYSITEVRPQEVITTRTLRNGTRTETGMLWANMLIKVTLCLASHLLVF